MAEALLVLLLCVVWMFLLPRETDFAVARPMRTFPWVPPGATVGILKVAGLVFVAAPATYMTLNSPLRVLGVLSALLIAWTAWAWLVTLARS